MKYVVTLLVWVAVLPAWTQGGPPPGPPPLQPPPQPPGNPVTFAKANLGKALFWDEQLSSTRTTACATCHIPAAGGTDNRVAGNSPVNPGVDAQFGTADDVFGSRGVPLNFADGLYGWSTVYGLMDQVTGRRAPSAVDAAYSNVLFWDGRAEDTFFDPVSGDVVLAQGAALETQALGPPLSDAEMGHVAREWPEAAARMATSTPLALASDIPAALADWIDGRSYPELFAESFGSADVTPARIAMAIATYERTLFSDQTPFDEEQSGGNALTAQERRGRNIFVQSNCNGCHAGTLFTDNNFHYIGVRPNNEDQGRFEVTGNNGDRGRFKTPGLRNVALRDRFFHNGQMTSLQEVVAFYNRGGDFNAPNKDPRIRPLGLNAGEQADLVAFLSRPLTDPRVAQETAPFDRPTLYTESNRVPQISGAGIAGGNGLVPRVIAIEPPLLGNPSFTVGLDNVPAGAEVTFVLDDADPGTGSVPTVAAYALETTHAGLAGEASVTFVFPNDAALAGTDLFGRWYVADAGAPGGVAVSRRVTLRAFGEGVATTASGVCGDVDGDGIADIRDTVALINSFGPCGTNCPGDLNGDGVVDMLDVYDQSAGWHCENR